MGQILFIINPIAGSKTKQAQVVEYIRAQYSNRTFTLYNTTGRGDAVKATKNASQEGVDTVVAVGGDGTINEVATGLLGAKKSAMGVVPIGSGNGFGRALGVPLEFEKAIDIVFTGKPRAIDMGKAAHRHFCAVAGVGFDAIVSAAFDGSELRGLKSYVKHALFEFLRYKPQALTITYDDHQTNCKPFMATVANANEFGNGAVLAPRAKMDDGLLDLCIAHEMSFPLLVSAAVKMFRGTIEKHSRVEHHQARSVVFRKKGEIQFHVDGEPETTQDELKIEVIPSALRVCCGN